MKASFKIGRPFLSLARYSAKERPPRRFHLGVAIGVDILADFDVIESTTDDDVRRIMKSINWDTISFELDKRKYD